ncbi:MAG: hypothetical protein WCL39_12060, partial [Armatimonadota bacterium]
MQTRLVVSPVHLFLTLLFVFLACMQPCSGSYGVTYTTNEGPKTILYGDIVGPTNGYDNEPIQDTSRQDWIYFSFWHEAGADGWDGPTAFYEFDFRGLLSSGQTLNIDSLYMWAGTGVPAQSMVLHLISPPQFTPNIASYKLRLVSIPAGITYNGPYVWYGNHGDITLPYYSSADGTTGYRFQAEISAV